MTRRSVLYTSGYFTLALLIFMLVADIHTATMLQTGGKLLPIASGLSRVTFASELVLLLSASFFILVTFLLKLSSSRIEKNRLTVFVILFDLIVLGFFVYALFGIIPSIIAGNYAAHPVELGLLVIASIPVLLDILSLPLERWGFIY